MYNGYVYSISSSDVIAVQAEDVKEKKETSVVPGRVVRRAKRQTSSQASYEGNES